VPASAFPLLLSPLRIRSTELRNRVVFTAHGSFLDFYRPGEPPDRYAAYLERRAQGGAGLIILQPVHVHRSSQALNHHVYEPADLAAKLAHVADRLHAQGAAALIQLMHFGAEFDTAARTDLEPLWGFSATTSPTSGEVAHEMTEAEILQVVEGFARTAAIAVEAGLDGVELHATHGYLVQQSFSPWANRRTDSWGDRRRFLTTTLRAIRELGRRDPSDTDQGHPLPDRRAHPRGGVEQQSVRVVVARHRPGVVGGPGARRGVEEVDEALVDEVPRHPL
jgi:2,4-dienoyl-CoA reductase-like NADH-dependent reductase (Old Yellow Enzyme family)